jgi:hypothetical protein
MERTGIEPVTSGLQSGLSAAWTDGFRATMRKSTRSDPLGSAPGGRSLARDWRAGRKVSAVEGSQPEGVEVPLAWLGPEDVPILYANAIVAQFEQSLDAFILTIGQMTPPALVGRTPDEIREQLEQLTFVPVKPVARFALSLSKMREVVATLQANLDQYERVATMRPSDPR